MSNRMQSPDHLSRDEIRAAIEAFSDADWLRLDKVALSYSCGRRLEPEDLLQMALARAIAGTRHCPRSVDPVRFLAEAMRSIASDDVKARQRKPELQLVARAGGDGVEEFDFPDPAPNAETALADEQEAASFIKAILALFDDDLVAQTIIEGQLEDMDAKELRDLTGLDEKDYASKRRFIRRRIDRGYPKGWIR